MLAGLALLTVGVVWPPGGCIAGAALLAWGSTHVLLRRRPQLAAANLLVYLLPMSLLIGGSADLLNNVDAGMGHAIWVGELAIAAALMLPLIRVATQTGR